MLVSEKIREERINLVISNLDYAIKDEKESLEYVLKKLGDPLICISFIGKIYLYGASKNLLFEKDLEKFKQDMYIYGKLCIMSRDSRRLLSGGGIIEFCEMLMSNNKEIIDFLIRNFDIVAYESKKDEYIKSESDRFLARTILLALKGDWEDVIRRSDIYLNNPSKSSYHKYIYLEFEFLKALALKDSIKMKESIEKMLEKKVAKKMLNDMSTAFDFYLHIFVIMYAKIAMYHGIDLGIDHEIAPKELIDITPAKEYYEPYDFMKKFNLNTITKEEWLDWIYEYHYDVERLEKGISIGRFV
ncbi:Imm49 family immunity protein [Pseudostreptobacillus sp.]